jgi:hypothetical protein
MPRPYLLFFLLHCRRPLKHPHSLSSSTTQEKKQRKHRNPEKDDKPFGSSSSCVTQEKIPWYWFFLGCKKRRQDS